MNNFNSDEEVVEAMKKWWDDNGKSVIAGLVIGFMVVYGWDYYKQDKVERSAQASDAYVSLQQTLATKDMDLSSQQFDTLKTDHAASTYVILGALAMAKNYIQLNELTQAETVLEWAKVNVSDTQLTQIVSLRLARVLLAQSKYDQVKKILESIEDDEFRGEVASIKGDLARANKDFPAAKLAYQEALANRVSNADFVKMKMDDLGLN